MIAERQLEAVEEKIADLNRLASQLRSISASCNGNRPMAEWYAFRFLLPRRGNSLDFWGVTLVGASRIFNMPAKRLF